jgi:UDP-N-acetylmuramate: L-alanyl-gamma-D-glutamyl-meso-diaminopimelate ligase
MNSPLDPQNNRVPEQVRHIHLMGICGTAMAALAGMLKDSGYVVTGSDENVYPPMSDFLVQAGIPVMQGYRSENLESKPDLVVVGNVIRAVYPEAQHLAQLGLPYLSMPQALGHFFLSQHIKPVVVAGTHGKTTTASLLATVLHQAGYSPGCFIGGLVEAFGANYRIGTGELFVVEGDEYDTAFFNKVSKFLHYRPYYAIITSIEFDHADIFADLEAIKASFRNFIRLLPPEGLLVACLDDPVVAELVADSPARVIGYGSKAAASWRLGEVQAAGLTSSFPVWKDGLLRGEFTLPMPGQHNALNALAVIALLTELGLAHEEISQGLISFQGVKRRQQIRGEVQGITVVDDFAHHPTAVRETIRALRLAWPQRRLLIVFEPRTNTSRRAIFQHEYARAFAGADMVLVREIVPLAYATPDGNFSSEQLAAALNQQGIPAHFFPDTEGILDFLFKKAQSGDVIAILSNGGFDNIHQRLLERLERNL